MWEFGKKITAPIAGKGLLSYTLGKKSEAKVRLRPRPKKDKKNQSK